MGPVRLSFLGAAFTLGSLGLLNHPMFAGTLNITSPISGSASAGAVAIAASARESQPIHLEIWDNGYKLGEVLSNSVNTTTALSAGSHTTTVMAVTNRGIVIDKSSVSYTVTEENAPGTVSITSPTANAKSINAVRITATGNESKPSHLEIWDNGYKLGEVFSRKVDGVYVLPSGSHTLTIESIANDGTILSKKSVSYSVAENCVSSEHAQCNMDQQKADNTQGDCEPLQGNMWIANPCGFGVQGQDGEVPKRTGVEPVVESGNLPNQGNRTLNGHSLHLWEAQENGWSNVLFRGQSATKASTSAVDSQWVLDEYVYLPHPLDHQAFEMDAQYSISGIWTKFYTECAFNIQSGTGYWAVFDSETGGWIFLNGKLQNGQTPPVVPCNRSQFAQPWAGSGNPAFTGWHHVAWSFLRNDDGTVTFQKLVFDGTTTQINFRPNSRSGGYVTDNGSFSALIQLDGVANQDRKHDLVDAYVSQVNLIHTR